MIDQTVWLAPRATAYIVVCEQCAAEGGYLGAQVEGRRALERDHSAVSCPRGHAISVQRAHPEPTGVRIH